MPIELDERGKALENEYFRRKEEELIQKLKAKLEAEEAGRMNCPRCEGRLVETGFEGVKIDVCNSCAGVWFDAGELAQVIEKNENSGWLNRLVS